MFLSAIAWAEAQAGTGSIDGSIPVNLSTVIDRSFLLLLIVLVGFAAYAVDVWLDGREAQSHAAETAREWSRLQRTVRSARRDFGGAR